MLDRVKKLEIRGRRSRVFGGFPLLPHGVTRTLRLRGGLTSGYGKQEDFVAMRTQSYTHYSLALMTMEETTTEDDEDNGGDDVQVAATAEAEDSFTPSVNIFTFPRSD